MKNQLFILVWLLSFNCASLGCITEIYGNNLQVDERPLFGRETSLAVLQLADSNGATFQFQPTSPTTSRSGDALQGKHHWSVNVPVPGENPWEPQLLSQTNSSTVHRDDLIEVRFSARLPPTSKRPEGEAAIYLQRSTAPWTSLASLKIYPTRRWQEYRFQTISRREFRVGEIQLSIHLGFAKQSLEFRELHCFTSPNPAGQTTFTPRTYYRGQAPDSPWRQPANERIAKHRRAKLEIQVTNSNGSPVEGAMVEFTQLDHLFHFGSFVTTTLIDSGADGQAYRKHFHDLFNAATTPFYWGGETGDWGLAGSEQDRRTYFQLADYLTSKGIYTRGHPLLWPGWKWLPPVLKRLKNDPPGLAQNVSTHISNLLRKTMRFKIAEWDVVNEPFSNHDLQDILGHESIGDWFSLARQAAPNSILVLNETNLLEPDGEGVTSKTFSHLANLVRQLRNKRVSPISAIGVQAHFRPPLPGIDQIVTQLNRLSRLGLPLIITEFDVDIADERSQAAYTRDFLTASFSHPAVDGVYFWDFWEGRHWRPQAALIRRNWSFRQAYHSYRKLVFDRWRSRGSVTTNHQGRASFSGYLGRYRLVVRQGDKVATDSYWLDRSGRTLTLELK